MVVVVTPVFYAVIQYIIPPIVRQKLFSNVLVGKQSEIPTDSVKVVRVDKKAVALVHNDQGQIKALSAVCTHLGCIVHFQSDRKVFHCNCHGSEFDMNGNVISGPAKLPLQPYKVDLKDDDILISNV